MKMIIEMQAAISADTRFLKTKPKTLFLFSIAQPASEPNEAQKRKPTTKVQKENPRQKYKSENPDKSTKRKSKKKNFQKMLVFTKSRIKCRTKPKLPKIEEIRPELRELREEFRGIGKSKNEKN